MNKTQLLIGAVISGMIAGAALSPSTVLADDKAKAEGKEASCKGNSCKGHKAKKGAKKKKDAAAKEGTKDAAPAEKPAGEAPPAGTGE